MEKVTQSRDITNRRLLLAETGFGNGQEGRDKSSFGIHGDGERSRSQATGSSSLKRKYTKAEESELAKLKTVITDLAV